MSVWTLSKIAHIQPAAWTGFIVGYGVTRSLASSRTGAQRGHRARVSHGQKTSPPEAIKGKSPERSGLQLDVEAALPIGKAAAIEVRLSSETLAVT